MVITQIHRMNPDLHDSCNTFLSGQSNSLIYHTPKFISFLAGVTESEECSLAAVCDGRITGILPALYRQGPFGYAVNSLPFFGTPAGVLAEDRETERALLEKFMDSTHDAASVQIVANPFADAEYAAFEHDLEDVRISQMTELLPDESEGTLWGSFDSSARRNIRKAIKSGVCVKIRNDMLDFLHDQHRLNMKTIGGSVKPSAFFEQLPSSLRAGTDYELFVALHDNEPAAALLLFLHGNYAEYYIPVIKAEFRSMQPLSLIIYEAMLEVRKRGIVRWNWGGTWLTQDGVYRFKKKWAARESEYRYRIKLSNSDILGLTQETLLREYPFFYTVPFASLINEKPK
ncbi:MAG: GNAT family N-acetyltransferase [Desulfobacterales bacterium]|nr:GNAT family N-acetyltransferase [Desulfobacterales bacterium]